jgi:hypothetical protein
MKRILVCATAILALAACSKKPDTAKAPEAAGSATTAATPAAPALTPPERKAGLWEQKVSTSGMTQVSRICFSDEVNKNMTLWGQQGGKDMCAEQSMTPTPGGWKFSSTCNMGSGGTIVSTGEAKGDFGSHYTVNVKSTTSGAGAPQMNGEHAMTVEATWKGPCPAGFKPGDMELPGGIKVNMLTMSADGPDASGGKPSAEQNAAMRKMIEAQKKGQQ